MKKYIHFREITKEDYEEVMKMRKEIKKRKTPPIPKPNKEKLEFIKFILFCFNDKNELNISDAADISDAEAIAWANINNFDIYDMHAYEPLEAITFELELLDPNKYTEGNNPILSALFHTLINDRLGDNSAEVKEMLENNAAEEKFTNSLTKEQLDLYNEAYWEKCYIDSKREAERFIFGFRFALMLVKEGFKP